MGRGLEQLSLGLRAGVQPLGGKLQGPEQPEAVLGMPALTGVPDSMQETPSDPTSVPAPLSSNVPAHAQNPHLT